MPLTIGPVKVFQSETPESQAKGVQRQAVSLQLTPTIIHALKQAIAAARADGRIPPAGNYGTGITPEQSPLQVALAGDNPVSPALSFDNSLSTPELISARLSGHIYSRDVLPSEHPTTGSRRE